MNLNGEKVILRAIEPEDAGMLLTLINDPEIEYLLGGWSFPISLKNQLDWILSLKEDKTVLRCIITNKQNSEAIGTIILNNIDYKNGSAAIHIKIAGTCHRGKGFGSDAINTIIKYCFNELRLHCIYANVNEDNIGSSKLFSKCGFMLDGILRDRLFKQGHYLSVQSFSIINNLL